ncbi:MAG: glycosyltransferase [Brevinematia bacterium]
MDYFFTFAALLAFLRIIYFYNFYKKFNFKRKIPSLVSIIIPARNEEKRIEVLLKSITRKIKYPIEIIVVDDNSTDNTLSVAKKYGAKVLQVKDFFNEEGKSIACYTGAINSKGDYLLFIDADVFFEDGAFDYIFENIPEEGGLTINPYHETKKFYEQFSLYSNIVVQLGLKTKITDDKSIIMTNGYFGPFFLIKREDYFKVDGHMSVKDSVIEDMELGKKLADSGVKIYTIPHRKLVKFRMYPEGLKTLFNGWSKNMALGAINASIFSIILISGVFASSFNTTLNLIKNISNFNYLTLIYTTLYILYSVILFISAKNIGKFKFLSCLLHSLFSTFYIIIFINSFIIKTFGLKIKWRERIIKP